jgi:GNAT superfamily N-acetyltransferase
MRIRRACESDFAAIGDVELSAGSLFEGTHMHWAVGETTALAELETAIQGGMLWVAELEGSVTGFLLGEVIESELHIWEVSVRREQQGLGFGKALVEAAAMAAANLGLTALTLTTDLTLPWNAPWYGRIGFTVLGDNECSPRLVELLANEPSPHLRCAMRRPIKA